MAAEAPPPSQSDAFRASARADIASVTSAAPEATTIASLPLDLLAYAFGFTPRCARLWVISLVCKRWRTAALRSITTLLLMRPKPGPTKLALLPALAHLKLHRAIDEALPTSLRSLCLYGSATRMLHEAVSVSRRYPSLTKLALPHGCQDASTSFLLHFLRDHSTQIERLHLGPVPAALMAELSLLPWPRLKCLSVNGCPGLAHLPTLSALKLMILMEDFLTIPSQVLPVITSLYFHSDLWDPVVLDRLRQCTRLRSVTTRSWSIPDETQYADIIAGSITQVMLKDDQSWEWLAQFRALEELHVGPHCLAPSLSAAITFPRLSSVHVGDLRPVPAIAALALAEQIIRCFPRVRTLSLYLDASAVTSDVLAKGLCELVTLCASLGLSLVHVSVKRLALEWTPPPAVVNGWIAAKVIVLQVHTK